MPSPPNRLVHQLARIEVRLRQGLDRAANRLEDNDPLDVLGYRTGVKLLNLADRALDFRARHRALRAGAFEVDERRP